MIRKPRLFSGIFFIQTQVLETSCPHNYVEFMFCPHIASYSVNLLFLLFHSISS